MSMRARVLIVSAAVPLVLWAVVPLVSQGAPAGAQNLQSKIGHTQAKIGAKKARERVLTTVISGWTRKIDAIQGDISRLQAHEARVQSQLDVKRAELLRIQNVLREERARLVRLRARLAQGRRLLADRLVQIYKAGEPDIITVLLQADGFAELIERTDFMRRISRQDQRVIRAVSSAKAESAASAKRLAGLEQRSQRVAAAILARRDEIAGVRQQLESKQSSWAQSRGAKAEALASTREQRKHLEGDLAAYQGQVQAALQAAQRQSSAGFAPGAVGGPARQGTGSFVWPVNGPITSQFCERRAWESCHPGIDIGVAAGTPIHAADSGRVVLASYTGGYGNYTCVQHTATLSTCYAHQSSYAVSSGQSVSKGQVIGYVGCTGLCFGAHLHFEVRVNGGVVNPLSYL